MSVIKNKGFRIFLYILGYISVTALIALTVITAMRYTVFSEDIDTANTYAETDSVRSTVNSILVNMQTAAQSSREWTDSGLEDASLDYFDYESGKKESVSLADLADAAGYRDVLTGLTLAADVWNNIPNYEGSDVYETYYNDDTLGKNSCFLKVSSDDFITLIEENAAIFSSDTLSWYYESQDISDRSSSKSTDEVSVYETLVRRNYTDYLTEGDRFILLDSGIVILSQEMMNIRRISGHRLAFEYFLNTNADSTLYIALPESYADKKTFNADTDEALKAALSGTIYGSPFEAFYSSLDNKQRSLILNSRNMDSGMYTYANTAYSFGGDEISGSDIWDSRSITAGGDPSILSDSYDKLASAIAESADIYVRYDSKTGELKQWYRDVSGRTHDCNFIENLKALTGQVNEDFVMGMSLYKNPSYAISLESLLFPVCKAVPCPIILLIVSVAVFLACVILLLIGVKAKLLAIDRVPFEIYLVCTLILLFIFGWLIPKENGYAFFSLVQKDLPSAVAVVLLTILALYVLMASLFTTIARRVKCRCFAESLLVVKLGKLAVRGIRLLSGKASQNRERISLAYENSLPGNKRLIIFGSVLFGVNALILILFGLMNGGAVIVSLIVIAAEAFAGYHLLKYCGGVEKVLAVSRQIESGDLQAKTDPSELQYNVKELGESLNHLGTGLSKAVESSIRDERTKAELITNVSHDIKTPLTSVISYVDLLKNEQIDNERAREYINVLDQKSQRLKQLIMDLIEVSKTNTGNIELERTNLNFTELLDQAIGEYEEKMAECSLEPVKNIQAGNTVIYADGRRVFRIIDNVFNNVVKYAQPGTRVYIDLENRAGAAGDDESKKQVVLSVKNVSREMLNISAEELTERFVRGDRARHTEGSGLGLSIAKNLTELQGGAFRIQIDGDLFKIEISFPAV